MSKHTILKALKKDCDPPDASVGDLDEADTSEEVVSTPVPVDADTESTEWCEFDLDKPKNVTLFPMGSLMGTRPDPNVSSPTGSTTGTGLPQNPPTRPGSNPDPVGDPRRGGGRIIPFPLIMPTDEKDDDESKPNGDTPPVEQPEEDTPKIPTTVFVKAKSKVLNGDKGTKSSEIAGQRVKLIPDQTKNPPLPTDPDATRDQTGADQDPAQCTTDNKGECQIMVEDAGNTLGLKPGYLVSENYEMEVETPQASGATLIGDRQLSGGDKNEIIEELEEYGLGANDIKFTDYRIGDKWITRVGYGLKVDYGTDYNLGLGGKYQIEPDLCRTIQPGPPLGSNSNNFSAIGGELPRSVISLPPQEMTENAQ